MLSKEDNEILTRVGPGTLDGQPAAPLLDAGPALRRAAGARLPAACACACWARTSSPSATPTGDVGLVAQRLPAPRRLAVLRPQRGGRPALRLPRLEVRHDRRLRRHAVRAGRDRTSRTRCASRAYPTHESGGIVWTYMGPPETMTAFRDFGTDAVPREQWRATKMLSPTATGCRRMEGNIDTSHISWLHQYLGAPRHAGRRHRHARLPDQRACRWKFWAHDRAPRLEVEDDVVRLPLRRHPHDAQRPHPRAHHAPTSSPYTTVVADDPVRHRRRPSSCRSTTSTAGVFTHRCATCRPAVDRHRCSAIAGASSRQRPRSTNTPYGSATRPAGNRADSFNGISSASGRPRTTTRSTATCRRRRSTPASRTSSARTSWSPNRPAPIYDRTQEHLGTTDKAIIRMRRILIEAAKDLANGIEPPATDPSLPYDTIRSAEKILAPGEDWRVFGTNDDPMVQTLRRAATKRP